MDSRAFGKILTSNHLGPLILKHCILSQPHGLSLESDPGVIKMARVLSKRKQENTGMDSRLGYRPITRTIMNFHLHHF